MFSNEISAVPSAAHNAMKTPFTKILLMILLTIVMYYIRKNIKYYRKLPPGPWGLPFVGYLPWVMRSRAPHSIYLNLASKYGPVTSLKLGSNLVVCLGSAKLVRELFNRADSTGRPHTPLNNLLGGRGIVLSEGNLWRQQRLFLSQKFRALVGVKVMEKVHFGHMILNEIKELVNDLNALNGAPADPVEILGRYIHNVICQLMISFRFKKNDEEFIKYNERVAEGMRLYGALHIGEHIPSYLKLPGKAKVVNKMRGNLEEVAEFHINHLTERMERRHDNMINGEHESDLLDFYLDVLADQDSERSQKIFPGAKNNDDAVKQVVQVLNDLFSAGMETSRTTLVWSLVMMLREPQVATKVRYLLNEVVGNGNLVTLKHQPKLAYVEAVIFETLRRTFVVPLGTTHVNSNNWIVDNYLIPAGTHIVPLINKIHMDPENFPEPEKFIPERFIRNGVLINHENFMPFGIGRRKCLGENLARMELFLFFANIMNNYRFKMAQGELTPELDGVLGITHAPRPFNLCFERIYAPEISPSDRTTA